MHPEKEALRRERRALGPSGARRARAKLGLTRTLAPQPQAGCAATSRERSARGRNKASEARARLQNQDPHTLQPRIEEPNAARPAEAPGARQPLGEALNPNSGGPWVVRGGYSTLERTRALTHLW